MVFNHQAFLAFASLACSTSHGFTSPPLSLRPQRALRATEGGVDDVNGAAATRTTTTVTTPTNQLAFAGQDNKSRLASAFAALDETDQYDAVLTGLCAKILDDSANTDAKAALQDPFKLLQEMNIRRVKASGRSLMALIDATVVAQDAATMADMMSLCLKNGGVSQFGSLQSTLTPLPASTSSPFSKILTPDGTRKTREERLAGLADVPVDDRGSELASALACTALVAACGVVNIMSDNNNYDAITMSTLANTVLVLMAGIGIVDNFYDVIQLATRAFVSKQDEKALSLPEKGSMPLQLGSGKLTGTVVRGLTRLTTVDTERECECEAAAFYAAYVLGLPCFAFRPNALESAVLVVESVKSQQQRGSLDPLLSSAGILKVLVWLLAPVAMESSRHAQLVMSDPRESMGFLERLEDKAKGDGSISALLSRADLFWTDADDEEQEKMDLVKWAYAEADLLLRANRSVVTEISQRLAGGAATVGDCAAVIEGW
ncbi:hypothetical protein MHU86_45 [Fragilaria crotonensis]|nr:hypothetical protein MHU86_45 [Fragilaria crotonensis]